MITPNEQYTRLAKAIGYDDLYFKREDLHPLGSHKGRSIPVMIDYYYEKGARDFAISSSGNAALAATLYIKDKPDTKLEIFVGNNIAPHKLTKLNKVVEEIAKNETEKTSRIKITKTERPLQALMQAMKNGAGKEIISLRQSTDLIALAGYESLAREISAINKVAAVFLGTSSGTTAEALAQYFLKEKKKIQIHIVQTPSCHPLTEPFHSCRSDEPSISDAIVDKTALRKPTLIKLVKQTGGSGWCATNEDILVAQKLTKTYTGLDISVNSALSVAGALQAAREKYEIKGTVVCLISGE